MSRRAAIMWLLAGAALQLAFRFGLHEGWSDPTRIAAAFAAVVLVPGMGWLRLLAPPPGGAWLAPGWALGFGVAWNAVALLALHFAGRPVHDAVAWSLPIALLPCVIAVLVARDGDEAVERLPGGSGVLVWAAAALAAWAGFAIGPPMTWISDSPDHVGTIRRIVESGHPFPADAFFRDAGALGVDPRKGLWHPLVAWMTALAGVDPEAAWRALSGIVAPWFALNAAALGVRLAGAPGAAIAAWALVLTYGGAFSSPPLREAMFSTKLADQLALAALTALVTLADAPRRRLAAALAVLSFAAIATHLFAVIHLGLAGLALVVAVAIRDRSVSPVLRRLVGSGLLAAAVALPFLLWRAQHAYAPANPIHTEPQGLLLLGDRMRVVSIGVLWDWMGHLWLLFPLAWIPLWRWGRGSVAALLLLASSIAVAIVLFVPWVVALLEPRLGYLLMRFIWIPPLAGLIAWLLPELARRVRAAHGRARLATGALLALAIFMLGQHVLDAAAAIRDRAAIRQAMSDASADPWRDALMWMRDGLARGSVVLSDPATSYTIPMVTGHYVVTLVDQHSSPNDSLALERLLDARDALDPWTPWSRARALIERHGATAIALNDRFPEPPQLEYWAPRPEAFAAARARFDAHPQAFPVRFDTGDFVVYAIDREALARIADTPAARPYVRASGGPGTPVARRLGAGRPALVRAVPSTRWLARGDTLAFVMDWRRVEPLAPGSWSVPVRFDRALPGGFAPPRWIGKPARKLLERLRGERYRFREDHIPIGGAYSPDRWRQGELVRDSFAVVVPHDAAPGTWTVRVGMIRDPVYPNYRLSDYFFDDDYYAGLPVTTVAIVPDRAMLDSLATRPPGTPVPHGLQAPNGSAH